MKKYFKIITGIVCGILNGLFGSGGGVAAVPMLERYGIEAKKSHATSVAIIFFMSLMSCVAYFAQGNLDYKTALKYMPWGIIGALVGSFLLKKVPNSILRRIFGTVILISAVRTFIS